MHVAIVALGPSSRRYVDIVEAKGSRQAAFDQVWVINNFGSVLSADVVFHMDDVRIQEARAAAKPDGKIANMLRWLKTCPGPVYTSRPHPDYPGLVAYPLEDVINRFGSAYFNNTAAYAIAYALFIGASELSLFGMDFTWPSAHHAEQGRGCCEYWLGRAHAMGVQLHIADTSTLMDTNAGPVEARLYGYDTVNVAIAIAEGRASVTTTPRVDLPSASDIEARYDHARPIVEAERD